MAHQAKKKSLDKPEARRHDAKKRAQPQEEEESGLDFVSVRELLNPYWAWRFSTARGGQTS